MFLLHPDIFWWDITILLFIALGLSMGAGSFAWLRRDAAEAGFFSRCLAVLTCIAGCTGCALVIYGSFIEPHIIVIDSAAVTHPLAHDMRIVVVSDLHVGAYKSTAFVKRMVDTVNMVLPDMVLMPGDFVLGEEAQTQALAPLRGLRAPLGVFAVLGNHDVGAYETLLGKRYDGTDHSEEVATALAEYGVRVLRNDHQVIPLTDGAVAVGGTEDLWKGKADPAKALSAIPDGAYTILLSHNPDVIDDDAAKPADLIVSGHTHGGQLRLPFIGPLSRIPTALGEQFDQGMFPLEGGSTLAITRGIGESSARARLFAWPQILVLEVKAR